MSKTNSLISLVNEIEDAYWDASIEVDQARGEECDDIAENALMADDSASHTMNRLSDRIEDLKRMVNARDWAEAGDFEPRKAYTELMSPLEDFVEIMADQLNAEAPSGGLNRDQEKTVVEYSDYMNILRRDIAVNLRNMVASCVRSAIKEYRDSFVSGSEADSFAEALISKADMCTVPKCPWPRLLEAVHLTAEVLKHLTEKCGCRILRKCEDNSSDYDFWVDVFYYLLEKSDHESLDESEGVYLYSYQTKDFTLIHEWCKNGDEQDISVQEMAVHRCDETDFGIILRRVKLLKTYEKDMPEEFKKRVDDLLASIPDDERCR